jgi:hypothetical protein
MMRQVLLVFTCIILAVFATLPPQLPGNPIANSQAIVIPSSAPNVRFTVLTDSVIRMEYVPSGATSSFVDLPTTVVWNRDLAIPKFTVRGPILIEPFFYLLMTDNCCVQLLFCTG